MTLELALAGVTAFVIGFAVVSLLSPAGTRSSPARLAFRIFLGLGVGQGITACLLFVFLVVHGRPDRSYVAWELLVLLGIVGLHVWTRRSRVAPKFHFDYPRGAASVLYEALLAISFGIAVVAALAAIGIGLDRGPYGDWDAWAIYNLRARSIYRGGDGWRDGFTGLLSWSHPDYPLLLPMAVVRAWLYAGGETMEAPRMVGGWFIVATMGLVPSALAVLRGRAQACIAGVVLLGNVFLIRHASSQYADVPLMFFFSATAALLVMHDEIARGQRTGSLVLAGLTAGLAAWTKNEGLFFLVAVMSVHLAIVARTGGWREYSRQVLPFVAGALPVAAIVILFKTMIAPPSDLVVLVAGQSTFAKIVDPARYLAIATGLMQRMPAQEGFRIGMIYALAIYGLCVGIGAKRTAGVAHAALLLPILYAGYLVVYLVTPYDLSWHIATSMDRVLVQVWPTFVFAVFLVLATPDEIVGSRSGLAGGSAP